MDAKDLPEGRELMMMNHVTSVVADRAKVQFSNLCTTAAARDLRDAFHSFARQDSRLDWITFTTALSVTTKTTEISGLF
jgi:hypothetical protein